MEKITFKTIADSLACGREIELFYSGRQYSLTNSHGYWNFCCDTDHRLIKRVGPFDDTKALAAYISAYCVDGVPLPLVFDEGRYDSVCIL